MTINLAEKRKQGKAGPAHVVADPQNALPGYGWDITYITEEDIEMLRAGRFFEVGADGEYAHYLFFQEEITMREEPMTTESQYPQPKPSHDFRVLLAALDKYLNVNTSLVPKVCPDDLAWVIESAFSQWVDGRVDDKLDDIRDEMGAVEKYVLANCPKILEAAEPPEDRAFEEGWAGQQQRQSQEEQE